MKSVSMTLKLKSSFISPFQSDTLFGHFCWTYLELYGEQALDKLLGDKQEPPIVFSDGFPSGFLPMPFLAPVIFSDEEKDKLGKDFKNKQFIEKDMLLQHLNGLTKRKIAELYMNKQFKEPPKYKKLPVFKNSLDSRTHTTQGNSGQLFASRENFSNHPVDIYAVYNPNLLEQKQIKAVFDVMGICGYGKDASTGRGRFEAEIKTEDINNLKDVTPNAFISLSSCVPSDESLLLYGKTFTKFGKHGGSLAGAGKHFKNPVILFKAGSTFKTDEIKPVYGKLLSNLTTKEVGKKHVHNACTVPLFCRIPDGDL